MVVTREILQADSEIRNKLWPFDFELQDNESHGPTWFDTASLAPFNIVAQRGSGCAFALDGPQQRLLLVTSDSQAGIMAESLHEGLELIVAHPYWYDIGSQAKGDLAEMRRILRDDIEELEESLDDEVDLAELQPWLRKRLGLKKPKDPLARLHHAVTVLSADVKLCAPDGHPLEPLFRYGL